MIRKLAVIVTICALYLACPSWRALAQRWVGASCGPVWSAPVAVATISYSWQDVSDDEVALLRNGVHVGSYSVSRGWRSYNIASGEWGPRHAIPPADLPAKYQPAKVGQCRCGSTCQFGNCPDGCTCASPLIDPIFGVESGLIQPAPANSINGHTVTRQQMLDVIAASSVPSDSGRLRVSVIGGSEADRLAVMNDLERHPLLVPFVDQTCRQEYAEGDWALQNGHKTEKGKVVVYMQKPTGETLSRTVGNPGPELLACAHVTALRRNAPDYDASKDPDLAVPPKKPVDQPVDPAKPVDPAPSSMPSLPMCCLLAVLALLVLARRSQP